MAEWVTVKTAARAAGYVTQSLHGMIGRGVITQGYIRRDGAKIEIDAAIIPWLIEHKQEWHAAVKQPDGAIHVPDPLGIQEGLWLTPDEAQRLLAIRELKRLYPTAQERNEAMGGDG